MTSLSRNQSPRNRILRLVFFGFFFRWWFFGFLLAKTKLEQTPKKPFGRRFGANDPGAQVRAGDGQFRVLRHVLWRPGREPAAHQGARRRAGRLPHPPQVSRRRRRPFDLSREKKKVTASLFDGRPHSARSAPSSCPQRGSDRRPQMALESPGRDASAVCGRRSEPLEASRSQVSKEVPAVERRVADPMN